MAFLCLPVAQIQGWQLKSFRKRASSSRTCSVSQRNMISGNSKRKSNGCLRTYVRLTQPLRLRTRVQAFGIFHCSATCSPVPIAMAHCSRFYLVPSALMPLDCTANRIMTSMRYGKNSRPGRIWHCICCLLVGSTEKGGKIFDDSKAPALAAPMPITPSTPVTKVTALTPVKKASPRGRRSARLLEDSPQL